jgi:molecular chaperone GrpE
LLDVLDIFDRALGSEIKPENINGFVDGIRLTAEELRSVLSRFGVSGHDPVGERFDPLMHEALSSEETDRCPPGHITQVFRRSYRLHDRVIRPAQVVVAKELSNKG